MSFTAITLVASLLWLTITVYSLARDTTFVRRSSDERQAISEWRAELQTALISLNNAETGQRGYLLTGKERYLAPYRAAMTDLPPLLGKLADQQQQAGFPSVLLSSVQHNATLKLDELAETIRLARQGQHAAAVSLVTTDEGQQLMEQLRTDIGALAGGLNTKDAAIGDAIVQRVSHRERLAFVATCALLISILLAGVQAALLFAAQRRFESVLAASEQRHRALIDEQTEMIALVQADGRLSYTNPAFGRFFELPADALQGSPFLQLLIPADRNAMDRALKDALTASEPVAIESRSLDSNGRERWFSWRLHVQQGIGASPAVHAVGRDVTPRKSVEAALVASEDFLKRTGRVAGIGGWELNLSTAQFHWSSQVRRILEVNDEYVPTVERAFEFFPEDARETLRRAMDDARFRGTSWDLELPLTPTSGHQIYVRAVGEAELDADGVPYRLVGTLQDVTDRHRLEQKLEANERFIRGITDSVPVRLAYLDHEGRFQFANRALVGRLRTTRESLLGRPIGEVVSEASREALRHLSDAVTHGLPQRYEYEDLIEGEKRRIEAQLIPDVGEGGCVRGVYTIGIDITHLKRVEKELRELTEVFDNTTDFVAQTDWKGRVHFINKSARRALGIDQGESLEGRTFQEFYTPETNERFLREIVPAVKRIGVWIGETHVVLKNNRIAPVNHMVIGHLDSEGRVTRYSSLMRDITEEVNARRQLARQTAILNTIIEAIPAMVAVFDRDMRYLLVNKGYERWRRVVRSDLIGRTVKETMDPEEYQASLPWAERALAGETVSYEKEYPGAVELRHVSLTYLPLRLDDDSIVGFFGVAQDITLHREENLRLLLLAERDAMTGLLNRVGFEQFIESKFAQGEAASLAVIYIDLDYFKPVNDTYGHSAGDKVLCEFALRLLQLVRPTDAVARLGGDEFAVILSGVRSLLDAGKVADKIVQSARLPFYFNDTELLISASVGVACDASGGWKALLDRADAMAYRAKATGRGRAVLEEEQPESAAFPREVKA
ncbi:MAG TPA: PAS domain-containing protein [Steroidobacteraceae bacterium]|nr:PAS domain-containing protein [Steroidobacteraceae bacterium]